MVSCTLAVTHHERIDCPGKPFRPIRFTSKQWEKTENGEYRLYVKVPFDTNAFVKVPWKKEELVLVAGEYEL